MKSRIPAGYGGGMNDMAKRVKMMQEQIEKKTDELNASTFTSSVGGGVVEATVNGKKMLESLTIKPEVVDPEDVDMLQDLIIGAINEAMRKVDDTTEEEMNKITGGMSIPGLI